MPRRLLIVGNPEEFHVGAHFLRAAHDLGIEARLVDERLAWSGSRIVNRVGRALLRRPAPYAKRLAKRLLETTRDFSPETILTIGTLPLSAATLRACGSLGARRITYSTDDPWNPHLHAQWLVNSFREYDAVFTPRRVNAPQFREAGCGHVEYLPFAYDPSLHRPADEWPSGDRDGADVVLIGGADSDRIPFARALIEAGLDTRLYGGFWDRHPATRDAARGMLPIREIPAVLARAKTSIGIVRRSNRDSHSMRTFEEPAMGACMVLERTEDHAEILGSDLTTEIAFETPEEVVHLVKQLTEDEDARRRLRQALRERIVGGGHTYSDRLRVMLR